MKKAKTSNPKILKTGSESDLARNAEPETDNFLIVGIGASAGGVRALKTFFENVPVDSGSAYVVILHLSPDHDSQLAEVLQTAAAIPVMQVKEKVLVEPNRVYVVPPNRHLEMSDGHIVVSPVLTVEERRAPVDIFFRTLAESHAERSVAVILSGTGANGSMGIKRIKEKGGVAFVQNPREAEFSEMPRNSIATDLIDLILNVGEIPAQIAAYRSNGGKIEIPLESEKKPEKEKPELQPHEQALLGIFSLLRVRTGHDFANYKRATILRRIERRINVRGLPDIESYAAFLRENPDETHALLKDLLISVTNFFRDKETFLYLENEILPKLFDGKNSDAEIRVWVAGCATGEEAYSLAMFLAEQAANAENQPTIQIFATDIDQASIQKAREGFYTLNDAADVSPERLKRFFTKEPDGFRIRPQLRELILFAQHNVIKDPPFSRLDLVTCRNMLIYLNSKAQERVMETFHFSLNASGYLFLGSSETADGAGALYAQVSREHRIYQSRRAAPRVGYPVPDALVPAMRYVKPIEPETASDDERRHDARPLKRISFADLHQRLIEEYTPSIVVNETHDIVHTSESSLKFLKMSAGEPTRNLLKLIRPELRIELRTALYQAAQRQKNVEVPNVKIEIDGGEESFNLSVRPVMRQTDQARGFVLVLFEAAAQSREENETIYSSDEPIARQLEEELIRTKEQLGSAVEQYEVQAEELKASNEELQAMNEELRSSAEELETGKEELQSLNEELGTVNQELKIKIEELSQNSSYLNNLINSTDIATVFLDRQFRVDLFTPAAAEIFNLKPVDIGRPLADIANRLEEADLLGDAGLVLEKLQTVEREARTVDGRILAMRMLPHRAKDDKIGGVVVTFYDITERKRAEEAKSFLASIVESSEDSMITVNFDRVITSWNRAAENLYGYRAAEVIGKPFTLLTLPEDLQKTLGNIDKIKHSGQVEIFDTVRLNKDGREMNLEIVLSPVKNQANDVIGVSTIARDVTERRRTEAAVRESDIRYRAIVGQSTAGITELDLDGTHALVNPGYCEMLGYTEAELFKLTLRDVTHPDDYPHCAEIFADCIKTGAAHVSEKRIVRKDGTAVWITDSISLITDAGGKPSRVATVAISIDERKIIEAALGESETRLRLLIESVSDYAIFTLSPDGLIDSWNQGAERVFGWTETEALGQTGAIIFTPEDRAAGAPEQEINTALRVGRAPDERFHLRRDDSRFFASGVMTLLKDGGGRVEGFVKVARDMTEQLQAEKAVRDKEMLQKLIAAQEEERKRIARDLHDELGQQLTALRLKLDAARRSCRDDELCRKIDEIDSIAESIDGGVDFLAWELRPAALDDLGLIVALDNYIKQWSRNANVAAELLVSSLKRARFAPEIETNLYRIVQEALNNTHKHARAKSVEIVLEKRDGLIVLLVADDGAGFNPKDKKKRGQGIGLVGMRERAALIGGTLEIESAPGAGTTVFVRVPAASLKRRKSDER